MAGVRHRLAGIQKGSNSDDRDDKMGRNDDSRESLAGRRTLMMMMAVMTRIGRGSSRWTVLGVVVLVVVAAASSLAVYFSFWIRHNTFWLTTPSNLGADSSSTTTTISKSLLRFDWTNLGPSLHPLTQRMVAHTHNCSLSMATFAYRKRFGLGSDLHMYAQAVCNAMYANLRVRTVQPWSWGIGDGSNTHDKKVGKAEDASPMRGFFQDSELVCHGDVQQALDHPEFDGPRPDPTVPWPLSKANGHIGNHCNTTDHDMWRLATIDMLFRHVTPRLQREAERQLQAVFGTRQEEEGTVTMTAVPRDLITVHIRWGDKVTKYTNRRSPVKAEMEKVQIDAYIDAVHQILDRRRRRRQQEHPNSGQERQSSITAHIYLATEDPAAVEAFRAVLPDGWTLYVDQFLTETLPHRVDDYNGHNKMAQSEVMKGKVGLMALGSLLVAMEANDFVLTTASNWSLLMNELRKAILDPQCGNCTTLIDLRPAKS